MNEAYIVAAVRTAGGRHDGRLKDYHPAQLGAAVLDALVERTNIDPEVVEDVIFGCVGQAGEQSVNIARNVVLASKFPESVPGTSVDRQCGSSQQAIHFAAQAVMSGSMDIVIAGGVESMSRVPMGLPMLLPQKSGYGTPFCENMNQRYPNAEFSQFLGAEKIAKKYALSRQDLDEFAFHSHQKAIAATNNGLFDKEILPLEIITAEGNSELHNRDEGIRFDASLESIQQVKLLSEEGVITAATSSQICDGASGLMIVNKRGLKTLGIEPLARIHQMAVLGHDPVIMLEAPIPATHYALKRAKMTLNDIDLFEVNEAFASIPLAWAKALDADPSRLNIHGGAIALGHPLGGSGAKLMTTLLHALQHHNKRYGLQTMCEGGGLANVTIIERL